MSRHVVPMAGLASGTRGHPQDIQNRMCALDRTYLLDTVAPQYERDGIVFPISVLMPEEIVACRSAFEELVAHLDPGIETVRWTHLFFRWAYDLATHPAVVDAVEAILGPDIFIRGTIIMCKQRHSPSYVSWHQDGAYANVNAYTALSAWIALTDSTAENGCMRMILGSHREQHAHLNHPVRDNLLHKGQEVQAVFDEAEAVDVTLKAGQMSLHHFNIIHGSNPNRSDGKRVGFVIRYVTALDEQVGFPVIRVRGQADCSHLDLAKEPPEGSLEERIYAWKQHELQRQAMSR